MAAYLNSAQGGSAQLFIGCDCTKYGMQAPLPKKIQDHDEPHIAHHNHLLCPSQFDAQACMLAATEATLPAVALPWDIALLYVPPEHTVYDAHLRIKADATMTGLVFDVVALTVDPTLVNNSTGAITIGAAVAGAIPAAGFTGVAGGTSATVRGAVGLAADGYYTGVNGLMYVVRVTTAPVGAGSTVLSKITGQIGLVLKVADYMDKF
jgi:hypothetical protein